MNVKNLTTPILIIGLSTVFVIVTLGVYLTRGKSKFWISKKMLIGSLLLSLNAVSNQSCTNVGTDCYDPVPPDQIVLDNSDYSEVIEVSVDTNNKLTGVLYGRVSNAFSFTVTDVETQDTLQVGEILPTDGAFDHSTEDIFIELDKHLPANEYLVNLYTEKAEKQNTPIGTYKIAVKHED